MASKKKKKKKGQTARGKAADQRSVAKAEVDDKAKAFLRGAIKANLEAENQVPASFKASVEKTLGTRFYKRLVYSSNRRQMTPRQYANAILVKAKGKK